MNIISKPLCFVLFWDLTFVYGLTLFFLGFFSISYDESVLASTTDIPYNMSSLMQVNDTTYTRQVSKIVLMIIDGMRFDFATSEQFKFVSESIANKDACLLRIKGGVPTVTMPGIKTIVTGKFANFIDIVLNFGHKEINSDSLLHQLKKQSYKIVFHGDDTWAKLFPNSFHRQSLNLDSFFVNDFFEGDKNITLSLKNELKEHDWDFLILHYLGLDHIGHVEGAFSLKMGKKLYEMDNVIKLIQTHIKTSVNALPRPALFLITADHGMKDEGGHGGGSDSEIFIPLLTFGNCNHNSELYNQIDIAPTVAVLTGVPIPATSVGILITELIEYLPYDEQLFALYYNNKHLLGRVEGKIDKNEFQSLDGVKLFNEALELHLTFLAAKNEAPLQIFEEAKTKYVKSSKVLSSLLSAQHGSFDFLSVILGLMLSTTEFAFTVGFSYATSVLFQYCFCYFIPFSSIVCEWRISYSPAIGFIIYNIWLLFKWKTCFTAKIYYYKILYILAALIVYAASLSSSSFVEEEHQTWFCIGTTILILLAIAELYAAGALYELLKRVQHLISFDFDNISLRLFKQNVLAYVYKAIQVINVFSKAACSIRDDDKVCWIKWLLLFIMHITIRRLNQTGDKWIFLSDLGDWLNEEENKLYLSIFFVFGLVLLLVSLPTVNSSIFGSIAMLCVYFYRVSTGAVTFLLAFHNRSDIFLQIFSFLIFIMIMANYYPITSQLFKENTANYSINIKNILRMNISIFCFITVLLHKPHNVILTALNVLTLKAANSACNIITRDQRELVLYKSAIAISIGNMFYFYQGNSNSLATIDLNPGFIGSGQCYIFISGILISLNTFSGPLCCLNILMYEMIIENDKEKSAQNIEQGFSSISLFITLPTSFYLFIMVIHRSHLFIWSVFSPKLLYMGFSSCYLLLLLNVMVFYFEMLLHFVK